VKTRPAAESWPDADNDMPTYPWMCSICGRQTNSAMGRAAETGEITIRLSGKPIAHQKNICTACIRSIRDAIAETVQGLRP
jgi:hypothetical protein